SASTISARPSLVDSANSRSMSSTPPSGSSLLRIASISFRATRSIRASCAGASFAAAKSFSAIATSSGAYGALNEGGDESGDMAFPRLMSALGNEYKSQYGRINDRYRQDRPQNPLNSSMGWPYGRCRARRAHRAVASRPHVRRDGGSQARRPAAGGLG